MYAKALETLKTRSPMSSKNFFSLTNGERYVFFSVHHN